MGSDVSAPVPAAHSARRRPAWIPTIAALVTIAVCVSAGQWQQRRMQQKEARAAQISVAAAAAPVPLPADVADWREWRYRTVTLTGEFDARHQILIDNKVHAGRVGFAVVTPFLLDDGRAVLVDRGFVAGGATRAELPAVPPPAGVLTFRGRVDIAANRYLELGDRPPTGPLWQNLDPQRFAQASGIGVLPIVIRALDIPGNDELVRDPSLPDSSVGKHVSYMLQWYTFAAMAFGLWLWFTVWPRLRRKRRE